jgi:hypothetical protein
MTVNTKEEVAMFPDAAKVLVLLSTYYARNFKETTERIILIVESKLDTGFIRGKMGRISRHDDDQTPVVQTKERCFVLTSSRAERAL